MTPADQDAWSGRKHTVKVGGSDIAYVEIAGREPALLLVHGFTDTSRSFSLVAPQLAGRRLIIPDLPGHGASAAGSHDVTPAGLAQALAGLIERLGLDRPIVVGHSLGGMIAIELAAGRPETVGGLVLLATTLRAGIGEADPMTAGVLSLTDPISPADPFYAYWHACEAPVAPDFLAHAAAEASAMPAARWRAVFAAIRDADLTETARRIKARTLIVSGGRDPLFDTTHRDRLRSAIPAASSVEAGQCGHNVHWEAPALVASAVLGHVDALAAEADGSRAPA